SHETGSHDSCAFDCHSPSLLYRGPPRWRARVRWLSVSVGDGASEPVRAADRAARLAPPLPRQGLDVDDPVQVVRLVLEHLGEDALALDADGLAIRIDALDRRVLPAGRGEPQPRHGQAALVDVALLSPGLHDRRVHDV